MAFHDAKSSEPWQVGVLFSRSGFMSVSEESQFHGTMIAIDEINAEGGVNGREIVPRIYDPSSDNSLYREQARRLLCEDGVSTIFGCYTSASRKAILPILERLNGLLWYPTIYEGFEYSPNIIYTGAAPNQNSLALCEFLIEHYGPRVYFVGSDYIYPHESNRIMRQFLAARGGEVVGESYLSLVARREDFIPVMRDIREARPDAIFSTVVGEATVYLYEAFNDFNLNAKQTPIASLTTTEAEIEAMGYDVGEHHITAASYFEGLDNPSNQRFVHRFKKRYGESARVNVCAEAAYFQVHLFKKALELVNTTHPDVLRPVVLGSSLEAPQGTVSINPNCSHANVWSRIAKVNALGQFDIVQQSQNEVVSDPFMIGIKERN
ncbi:transporter substrate-binding protein [Notoacmeibacter sp. MSK16QG-6]|uniref:transporter substrate-binding domain-containing protein n=1 Tax=Notoacmeibacter sp. MSK16QG-6 TaxID=2957982 RepID=UPI00209DF895|nr:transporter substrate-binding domain-containing protein [Notoacmeibacter sp. MSK16QG-6]